jgi:putative transposase
MANTFSQIYLQFVFAVKGRQNCIPQQHKEELHKFFTSLVQKRSCKMLAVNCMPDHIHIFIGYKPVISIPDFVRQIKVESNEFINNKKWIKGKFYWQEGYGVFSYSESHMDRVIKYVLKQEEHHKKKTFQKEYVDFLDRFKIVYDPKYLFEFYD